MFILLKISSIKKIINLMFLNIFSSSQMMGEHITEIQWRDFLTFASKKGSFFKHKLTFTWPLTV